MGDPYGFKSAARAAKQQPPQPLNVQNGPPSGSSPAPAPAPAFSPGPQAVEAPAPGPGPESSMPLQFMASSFGTTDGDDELSHSVPTSNGPNGSEPPLLEELDIDLSLMRRKALAALLLRCDPSSPLLQDEGDLSGPLLIAACLGMLHVLLTGSVTVGPVIGWLGCFMLTCWWLVNQLAAGHQLIPFYRCAAIVGYSLLPIAAASALCIILPSRSTIKLLLLCAGTVLSARCCTHLILSASTSLSNVRYIIAVPTTLAYFLFALLAY